MRLLVTSRSWKEAIFTAIILLFHYSANRPQLPYPRTRIIILQKGEEQTVSKLLREGIEKAKKYYIGKLTEIKFYQNSEQELNHLPLNELQDILKKENRYKKTE
jgi:hypothetical protein